MFTLAKWKHSLVDKQVNIWSDLSVFSFLFIFLTGILYILPLSICENNGEKFRLYWRVYCVFPLLGLGKACLIVHCIVAWSRHHVIAPEWWSSIGSCHGNQAPSLQPLQVKVHAVMIQQKQSFSHYMYICYWIKYYGSNISGFSLFFSGLCLLFLVVWSHGYSQLNVFENVTIYD